MSYFFFDFNKKVNAFENIKCIVSKDEMSIAYEGLIYQATKYLSLRELLLFINRDIYISVKNDELPKLTVKLDVSKKRGKGFILVTISGTEAGKYLHKKSVFLHVVRKIEKILWQYNRFQTFVKSHGNRHYLRFGHKIQFENSGKIIWKTSLDDDIEKSFALCLKLLSKKTFKNNLLDGNGL